jgi:small multidrug resistance pump
MNDWVLLFIAIALEVCGTTSMKLAEGFTRLGPSIAMWIFYAGCFTCFTFALRTIDLAVAYAIWGGLGTVVVAIIGFSYFSEPMTSARILGISLVIVGVIILKFQG